MKKLAIYYCDGKMKYNRDNGFSYYKNGYLFSKGTYETKIKEEDLPSYYIKLWLCPRYTYISLQGIKYIYYRPNFFTNHLRKDDFLFISYKNKIDLDERNFPYNYDIAIYGPEIDHFISELEKYGFAIKKIAEIKKLMEKKDKWYKYWDSHNWEGNYSSTSKEIWDEILGDSK